MTIVGLVRLVPVGPTAVLLNPEEVGYGGAEVPMYHISLRQMREASRMTDLESIPSGQRWLRLA